ncbi:MAG TPA: hypothetical protein DCL61_22870 [Cyanobacteria bacterium UBA12227]|nr:hypothetical protein [Cyanobacteria bacterium UBA12227]HAX85775.1 hypothetical protein [Cyanobacteria bacterium UBA11370]HBY79614.1 hypothetical protein [Cyanobacteria bacterium UBA11148]
MSQVVSLELRDQVYTALRQQAESVGISLSELILLTLERQSGELRQHKTEAEKETARARFERHFGTLNLEHPIDLDNESIDADLVREYASTHE